MNKNKFYLLLFLSTISSFFVIPISFRVVNTVKLSKVLKEDVVYLKKDTIYNNDNSIFSIKTVAETKNYQITIHDDNFKKFESKKMVIIFVKDSIGDVIYSNGVLPSLLDYDEKLIEKLKVY